MLRLSPLFLCLALAACGGEQSADGTDVPADSVAAGVDTDGCPWLDADLAGGILGETVTVSAGVSEGSCTIEAVPATTSAWITVFPSYSIDTQIQSTLTNNPTSVPMEISGLGDRAVWMPLPPTEGVSDRGMVAVAKGTQVLVVTVNRSASVSPQPDFADRAARLAEAIVMHM